MKIENLDFNTATYKELKLHREEVLTLFLSLGTMIKYCENRISEIKQNPKSLELQKEIEFCKQTINEAKAIKEKLQNAEGYLI